MDVYMEHTPISDKDLNAFKTQMLTPISEQGNHLGGFLSLVVIRGQQ